MTTTKVRKMDPRAKLLVDLKKHLAELKQNTERNVWLQGHVNANTYAYVTYMVSMQDARDVRHGCSLLANMLKVSETRVELWFYTGRFMAVNKLHPDRVDSAAARECYNMRQSLTKHELLRAIDLVKRKKPGPDVRREVRAIISKSRKANLATAERKAVRAVNRGEMTKTRCKMEVMACKTFLATLYGNDIEIKVLDRSGKVLIDVH
jgi:hypothetical protein